MKKVFIVAGEPSGDILGANLVKELNYILSHKNIKCDFYGIGGDNMRQSGVELLFHCNEIAVMGLTEVLLSYRRLLKIFQSTVKAVVDHSPDMLITIDSPGFNFRLVKKIRKTLGMKVKIIHYVAPTVWAYAKHRAQLVAELYQHIMLILPFESQYFQHMPHTFVGHPITQQTDSPINNSSLSDVIMHDINKMQQHEIYISILPGSRKSEVVRHMRVLLQTIVLLNTQYVSHKTLYFQILTLPHLNDLVRNNIEEFTTNSKCKVQNLIIECDTNKHSSLIQRSALGLVKCGTATLSFISNCVPAISFYQLSRITGFVMKRRLYISRFNLCNIIAQKDIVPELIQNDFNVKNITNATMTLLQDHDARHQMLNDYYEVWQQLTNQKVDESAANVVLKLLL